MQRSKEAEESGEEQSDDDVEKLQLADQGRGVKQDLDSKEEMLVPVTEVATKSTTSGSGRKAGRSFLDEFRDDLRAIVIDGDDDEDEKASKKQKLDNETKKLELQERELKLREQELNESRLARKEQMDVMVAIIHKLATTK